MDAPGILRDLRDGVELDPEQWNWVGNALADGGLSDAQAGALAMAVFHNGLSEKGRVALTCAMRDSGDVMQWDMPGPVIDKHSTGGIGDCVSLILAPALAEFGAYVPMISGRGLGHTGGTLDKLEAVPGFRTDVDADALHEIVREVGCAIVAANADIAPADKRLYAVRDVTSTVESIDLITASILSKKLAAGLEALVLDVKVGSGAFMASLDEARVLARSLVKTANGAGCRCSALITDMNQPLVPSMGNALEVVEVIKALSGRGNRRLVELSAMLCGEILERAGLAPTAAEGEKLVAAAIADGRVAERFAKMVQMQGGPKDVLKNWAKHLGHAPVQVPFLAEKGGYVSAFAGREMGMVVVRLGGGRLRESDKIDPSVGLSDIVALGAKVSKGDRLCTVHASDEASANIALEALRGCIVIGPELPEIGNLVIEKVE